MARCCSIKRDGERCQYQGKDWYGGFCGHHFPFRELVDDPNTSQRWGWPEIISVASGSVALLEFAIRLCNFLPAASPPPKTAEEKALLSDRWDWYRERCGSKIPRVSLELRHKAERVRGQLEMKASVLRLRTRQFRMLKNPSQR